MYSTSFHDGWRDDVGLTVYTLLCFTSFLDVEYEHYGIEVEDDELIDDDEQLLHEHESDLSNRSRSLLRERPTSIASEEIQSAVDLKKTHANIDDREVSESPFSTMLSITLDTSIRFVHSF